MSKCMRAHGHVRLPEPHALGAAQPRHGQHGDGSWRRLPGGAAHDQRKPPWKDLPPERKADYGELVALYLRTMDDEIRRGTAPVGGVNHQ